MGWSKQELVEAAFEEVGLPPYAFDIQPEQLQSTRRRMDAMVAEWADRGLQIGYNAPGALADDSGVPLSGNQCIYLNLALRIAPSLGKVVAVETKLAAAAALETMIIAAAQPVERQQPSDMPRGEGQKPWRTLYDPFMPEPSFPPLTAKQTDNLDLLKD